MKYVIHAADQIYGGHHGMEEWVIEYCYSEEDAWEIGEERSLDVINSYSSIVKQLDDEIESLTTDDMSEEDKDNLVDEVYREDVFVEIWQIKEDLVKNYTIDELNNMLNCYPEEFINEYCIL